MAKLGIGVIGVGRIGAHHARNLAGRVKGARLRAVADIDLQRARSLADELEVRAYQNYEDLLSDPAVDAVVIAGPTDQRVEMLEKALPTGKPIFCEKPLATSMEAIEAIKRVAAKHPTFLQLGFMRRYDPGYALARKRIAEGDIGEPIAVHAVSLDPHLASYDYIKSSGGMFVDLSIHDFDLVRFLMHDDVREVYSIGGVYVYEGLRELSDIDNGLVTLHFERGSFGTVRASRSAGYGYDIRTEVLGSKGAIQIGYQRQNPVLLLKKEGVSYDFVPFFLERFEAAYLAEMEDFVNRVLEGKLPAVGLQDGEHALLIALAAQRSLRSGKPEQVQYGGDD